MLPMWTSSKVVEVENNDEVWRAKRMNSSAMKDMVGDYLLDEL